MDTLSTCMNAAHSERVCIEKTDRLNQRVLNICVASINVEIDYLDGSHLGRFKPYLKDFQAPDIVIGVSQEDIECERQYSLEARSSAMTEEVRLGTAAIDSGSLEPVTILRKLADRIIPFDTILMHGAVVAKDGDAYMFIAPSGTGKTTRVRIWKKEFPDSVIVNGDKPLIKICSGDVVACGSPWCGKEGWNTNTMVPLRAVFLLSRADDKASTIEEISHREAFPILVQQTYRPADPDRMTKTIHLLEALDGKVKFYKFRSAPTPDAMRMAYEAARPR